MEAAAEPQRVEVQSSAKSIGQLQRRARALIGWMSPDEAKLWLAGRKVEQQDRPEFVEKVARAHAARASRPLQIDQTNVVTPVTDELSGHIEALRQHPPSAQFFSEGWDVGIADLSKVCAMQTHICIDQAVERVAGIQAEQTTSLAAVSLPIPTPSALPAQFDPDKKAWIFSSSNPNLRIVGNVGAPTPQGAYAFGFMVAEATSFVQVISYRGRWLLRDGYHRAYGFIRHGIMRVPVFVRNADTFDALKLPVGLLPQDAFLGDQPPLLTDYHDDEVSAEIQIPFTQKIVVVQGLELNTLG